MVEGTSRVRPKQFQEPGSELYSGESVLAEYARLGDVPPGVAQLVMTRFLVAQYFTNRLRGDWGARLLRLQRSAALNVIGSGLLLDRELRLLRRALELDDPEREWRGDVVGLLGTAAERAEERAHTAGAEALWRIVYEAAFTQRLWWAAADAAARLATLLPAEDLRGRTRWRRRASTLRRRARRAEAPT